MCREDVRIMGDTSSHSSEVVITAVATWVQILKRSANRASIDISAIDSADALVVLAEKLPTLAIPIGGVMYREHIKMNLLYDGDAARNPVFAYSSAGGMRVFITETLFNMDAPMGA